VAPCAVVAAMRTAVVLSVACLFAAAGCGSAERGPSTSSVPWRLERASRDGRVLTLRYERGACDRFERTRVQEGERAATIGVLVTNAHPERACIMVLVVGRTRVRLRAPLRPRRLLHDPVTTVRP
jgi:hypothetical protein